MNLCDLMKLTTYREDAAAHRADVLKHYEAMRQGGPLVVWAVFDNPKDQPGRIVVRANFIASGGRQGVSPVAYVYDSLEKAREPMESSGLSCLQEPEPPCVESWV